MHKIIGCLCRGPQSTTRTPPLLCDRSKKKTAANLHYNDLNDVSRQWNSRSRQVLVLSPQHGTSTIHYKLPFTTKNYHSLQGKSLTDHFSHIYLSQSYYQLCIPAFTLSIIVFKICFLFCLPSSFHLKDTI